MIGVVGCSNLEGSPEALEPGGEVEYSVGRGGALGGGGGGCASAEFVRPLPRGSVPLAAPLEPALHGTVTRTLRALNPDQPHYSGEPARPLYADDQIIYLLLVLSLGSAQLCFQFLFSYFCVKTFKR